MMITTTTIMIIFNIIIDLIIILCIVSESWNEKWKNKHLHDNSENKWKYKRILSFEEKRKQCLPFGC